MNKNLIYVFVLCHLFLSCNQNILLESNTKRVAFSAIKGEKSKIDTLVILNRGSIIDAINFEIKGENSSFFELLLDLPKQVEVNDTLRIPIQFQPDSSFVGLANAHLVFNELNDSIFKLPLYGLSTKGLEGKNEPPLSWVTKTLGYEINLGWTTLANHIRDDLQGEELPQSLFKKVEKGNVEMIPVARYSPAFNLPFGYYTAGDTLPVLKEVGVLSDSKLYPEHQTLFPEVEHGSIIFNPKDEPFGFYTTSPSHVAYSQDKWNKKLFKKHAAHASRIYPLKNSEGEVVSNQFLVCFEEAFNGDYQDYVFLVKNVELAD